MTSVQRPPLHDSAAPPETCTDDEQALERLWTLAQWTESRAASGADTQERRDVLADAAAIRRIATAFQDARAALPDPQPDRDANGLTEDESNLVLQVLCRAFDDDPAVLMDEWTAWYEPAAWLWYGRALGAFIGRRRADQLARVSADRDTAIAAVRDEADRPTTPVATRSGWPVWARVDLGDSNVTVVAAGPAVIIGVCAGNRCCEAYLTPAEAAQVEAGIRAARAPRPDSEAKT
jgi:hypothetical protein